MGRKKRKRQSLQSRKNNPESKYWQSKADKMWSAMIKKIWGHKCAICGATEGLQSHHMILKKAGGIIYRYDLRCGICLCLKHHGKFGNYESAHSGHLGFAVWLSKNHPEIWQWICDNIRSVKQSKPYPKANYRESYLKLSKIKIEEVRIWDADAAEINQLK